MSDPLSLKPRLDGLVPESLDVRSVRIHLDSLELMADIGFHEFEIGHPQRLEISVEIWLEKDFVPESDDPANAWNYDLVRLEIDRIAGSRRFNLQESLVREIYDWVASRAGVTALRVTSSKPDVYAKARGVGIELSSFHGARP